MLKGAEIRYSLSLISTAERRLARMVAEIAALPIEAEGTRLQTLGNEIIQAMETKLLKLRSNYQLLQQDEGVRTMKAAE